MSGSTFLILKIMFRNFPLMTRWIMRRRLDYHFLATFMLNLLRPEQKKKIIREYHIRFFVVGTSLFFVAEIIAIVLLVPSYVMTKARADDLNSKSSILQAQNLSEEGATLNAIVQKVNGYESIFLSSSTPVELSAILKKVVDNRGPAVRLDGFIYSAADNKQQIVVQGIANTRQDLLNFIKQ